MTPTANTPKDTLESLLESLEQAVKEQKRSDEAIAQIRESLSSSLLASLQQAVEERERNDGTIANIRESLSGRIEQMKQAKIMVDAIMGTPVVVDNTPIPVKANDTVSIDMRKLRSVIISYILPPVIMLAILLLVFSLMKKEQEQNTTGFTLPAMSLMEPVVAQSPLCIPDDDVDEEPTQQHSIFTSLLEYVRTFSTVACPKTTDESQQDAIVEEALIDDETTSAPIEDEQSVDTSVGLTTEVQRNVRERRLPLIQRIRR